MNILFFLTPKVDVAYIYDTFSLRQVLEKWSIINIPVYQLLMKTENMWGQLQKAIYCGD